MIYFRLHIPTSITTQECLSLEEVCQLARALNIPLDSIEKMEMRLINYWNAQGGNIWKYYV